MVPFVRLCSMSSSDDCFIFVRTVGLKPFLVGVLDVVAVDSSSEVGVSPSIVIDIIGCIVVGFWFDLDGKGCQFVYSSQLLV